MVAHAKRPKQTATLLQSTVVTRTFNFHLPPSSFPTSLPSVAVTTPSPRTSSSSAGAMGSVSLKIGDGTARFRRSTLCSSVLHFTMLLSVVFTNLFALYAFTSTPKPPQDLDASPHPAGKNLSLISDQISIILRQIESSQRQLSKLERDLLGYDPLDASKAAPELRVFLAHHPLPLGRDSRSGITEMVSSVAHSCSGSLALLSQFMSYSPSQPCHNDATLAEKLILHGCEPLPRRRCLSGKAEKPGLAPFPASLWKPVSEKISGGWNGLDKLMWVKARGKNDFLVEDVLALGGGGIRTGFDIGGGAGNFAARMAEKGVTVVTSTVNEGKPVNEFVAARGLFPLHLTPEVRFPFYNSVFDLVHTVNGLDEGSNVAGAAAARPEKLEFLMFDIDRILRPGGLFWLDNYLCVDEKRKWAITSLIEKFKYKKLKWVVGEKADTSGNGKPKVYLSAVLQKPVRK